MKFSSLLKVTFLSLIFLGMTNCNSEDSGDEPTVAEVGLAPGDTIRFQINEEPDLTAEVDVSENGEVRLPLVGSVKIAGLSVTAATKKISTLFADNYLKDPEVSIIVISGAIETAR